jgi:hypothetical protein
MEAALGNTLPPRREEQLSLVQQDEVRSSLDMDNTPVFEGEIRGSTIVFMCPHCKREHSHGAGPDPQSTAAGHRTAHCADPDSPYDKTGYVLVVKA